MTTTATYGDEGMLDAAHHLLFGLGVDYLVLFVFC